jgi:hypothetical protein
MAMNKMDSNVVILRPGDELIQLDLPAHKRVFVGAIGLSGENVIDPVQAQIAQLVHLHSIPNWQQLLVGERGPEDVFEQAQVQQRAWKVVTESIMNRARWPNGEHICSYIRTGEVECSQPKFWAGVAAAVAAALALIFFRRA